MISDTEVLAHLLESEVIRLVYTKKYTPKDLDNAYKKMKKRIRELEHVHQLDMAQIVEMRRQIDFLMGG